MKRLIPASLIRSAALLSGMAFVAIAQAQPAITSVYPNGTNMFQPSPTLSFIANSAAEIDPANITVQLTVTSLKTGQSYIRNLTSANGLTVGGTPTSRTASVALSSNTLFRAVINVTDDASLQANSTVNFDTISPVYTWEAEDWNYTADSVSGLFIDNPQTNAYAGLGTTDNVDAHNANGNSSSYRPSHANGTIGALYTENVGSPETAYLRLQYIGTGHSDYNVGFTDPGDFGNYTRTYPAGTYNLYVRAAGGNGAKARSADISVVSGNASIASAADGPYKFGVKGNGWQNYDFMPVTDSAGNLVEITFDGNPSTLQVLQAPDASDNMNFFMLMPLNTNEPVTTVTISDAYPDGAHQFQPTNKFSFSASSSVAINPDDLIVQFTGTSLLTGDAFATNFSTANGLIVSGSDTEISVTAPLASNAVYTALIQVNDANGIPASSTVTFDTIIPTYTFEAEDWDYDSGQYFDNPQTNAYYALDGVAGVDYNNPNDTHNAYLRFGFDEEGPVGDIPRLAYINTTNEFGVPYMDFNVGFTAGGQWGNYTRNYPQGVYNIYVRVARGDGSAVADAGSVSVVTSGYQTPNQTTSQLGKYAVPSTGNWQAYVWSPVRDTGGNLSRFSTDGSLKTLRVTMTGAGHNFNFFLLVPADLSQNPPPFVSDFAPDGSSLFQYTNRLSFTANSATGLTANDVVVNVDGVNVSDLTFDGPTTSWNITAPIEPNATHTAIITLTDEAGTTRYTNTFGAFVSTNYQWEAEDYDYGGRQFFNNQINAYNGLAPVVDVDNHQSNLGANPHLYRPNSAEAPVPSTQTGDIGGELPRELFTSGGGSGTDYCIGFFGNGSWVNYTRNFPAGTYNIIGRFAEGQSLTQPTMSLVTAGAGTVNQTLSQLGSFSVLPIGWSSWEWVTLKDSNGKAVKVTFDGSPITLRYAGSTIEGQPELNTGFFMLAAAVPDVVLTVTRSNGDIVIAFPTQNGSSYQVQYKNSLSDPSWTPLGGAIDGNGAVQTATDPATESGRFYRVQINN